MRASGGWELTLTEIMYGIGYYDPDPRQDPNKDAGLARPILGIDVKGDSEDEDDEDEDEEEEDFVDLPLRRAAVYHQHFEQTATTKSLSLWIVCSAKVHVEDALVDYLRRNCDESGWTPIETHAYLTRYCLQLWRLMLTECSRWLQRSVRQPSENLLWNLCRCLVRFGILL
jgi:hypothetical protein